MLNCTDAAGSRRLPGCSDASCQNPYHHRSVLHRGWGASRRRARNHQEPGWTSWHLAFGAPEWRVGAAGKKDLRVVVLSPWRLKILPVSFRWYRVETNFDHWRPPPSRDHRRWERSMCWQLKNLHESCCFKCDDVSRRRETASIALNVTGQDHINLDTLYQASAEWVGCMPGAVAHVLLPSFGTESRDFAWGLQTKLCCTFWTFWSTSVVQVLSLFPVCNGWVQCFLLIVLLPCCIMTLITECSLCSPRPNTAAPPICLLFGAIP